MTPGISGSASTSLPPFMPTRSALNILRGKGCAENAHPLSSYRRHRGKPGRRDSLTTWMSACHLGCSVWRRRKPFDRSEIQIQRDGVLGTSHPLRVTPAMEAGLADHIWTLEELVSLLGCKELKEAA
jgi:hypothetical protein